MPIVDLCCSDDACAHMVEYYRSLQRWEDPLPVCETCGQPTYQSLDQSHRRVRWTVDPVVVFKAPDGTFRFPGDGNGLQASHYQKEGFELMEIRGATEMRRFESHMNKVEFSRAMRKTEMAAQQREHMEKMNRSELRMLMQSMSPMGRAVARAAMQRNDGKPIKYAQHAGFHSEVYSQDRSNRETSYDQQGRRRRD